MEQIATLKDAYNESELPFAIGCSKRAAARIARELGVRVGGRRIVPRQKLLDWLDAQAVAGKSSALEPRHEFRISTRSQP